MEAEGLITKEAEEPITKEDLKSAKSIIIENLEKRPAFGKFEELFNKSNDPNEMLDAYDEYLEVVERESDLRNNEGYLRIFFGRLQRFVQLKAEKKRTEEEEDMLKELSEFFDKK